MPLIKPPVITTAKDYCHVVITIGHAACIVGSGAAADLSGKLYRMKETDLLLGHFAKSYLADLSDDDLTDFENLLAAGDHWIYAWVTGNEAVPDAYDTPVFKLIKNFKDNN